MPYQPSENDSSETLGNLFDLNLPVVREGEGPLPAPRPTWQAKMAHAEFLRRSGLAVRRKPNPEPFVMH